MKKKKLPWTLFRSIIEAYLLNEIERETFIKEWRNQQKALGIEVAKI